MRGSRVKIGVILCAALAFLAAGFEAAPAHAQETAAPTEIRVGIPTGYLPIAGVNLVGEPAGLLPDIWRKWSEKTGVPVVFKTATFGETVSMLRHGAIDVHASLFRNEVRKAWLDFTRPFHESTTGFFILRSRHDISSIAALDGKSIGVVNQSHQESFLRYGGHGYRIKSFPGSPEMLRALMEGEIDAVLHEDEAMDSLLHSAGVKGTVLRLPGEILRNAIFSAFRKNRPALRHLIDWGFIQISRQEYAEIEKRWIDEPANRLFRPQGTVVEFNEAEREFLRENKVIRVGMMNNWPPMNSVGADGKPTGMSAAIAELINERLGGIITFVPGAWPELLEDVKEKRLDAVFDITPTEARIPYYKFTFPYLDIPHGVVLHQDNVKKNLLQRKGVRIAVEEGYSTSDYILKAAPGGVVTAYPSTAAALTAVADKQADIYFGNVAAVRYQISENRDKLGVLAFGDNIPGRKSLLTIGTRYDWPILRGIFNKALMGLTPAQLSKVTDPWLKGTVGGKIEIDADEQRWLTNHSETTIRASMEPWPPVLYMQDGRARGIAVNYLRHIMKSLELDLTFVEMPWKDTLPAIDKFEKIDVVSSAANTPARRKIIRFTAPFISLPQVIFMRDDARLISGLSDLNDKTVAIEAGFASADHLRKEHPNIKLLEVENTHKAMEAVSFGRADAYFGDLAAGSFHIERHGLANLKIAAPSGYENNEQSFGVRRDWPELASLMNKVLASMTEEEHTRIRGEAMAVKFERVIDYKIVLQYGIPAGVVVVVVIGVFVFANRKLAGEVAERKKAEERLTEREQRFRSLLESAPDATLIVDPGGKIVRVNRQAEKLFGADRTKLIDQPIEILVPDEIKRKHVHYRDGFVTSSAPREMGANMDLHAKRFDGTLFPVEISLSPIETAEGTLIAASVRDVTERREQENKLREKDVQLTNALENMSGGMFMVDKQLRIQVFNRKFQEQYHIPNLIPGTPLRDLILIRAGRDDYGEGDIHQLVEDRIAMYRAMEAGRTEDIVPDGRVIEGYRQPTDDGGMVCVFNDITERKEAERQIAEQTEKLQDLSKKLSRYLSPQIYEAIFSGASDADVRTERKKLTVFFSDIKNFTATTEEMEPEDMTYILNDYLTKMTEVALEYGGTIDKYIGDAIMVFFGDPETKGTKQDALQAIKMAVAMQRRMVDLRAKWTDMGFRSPFHIRCGVNTGYCNVGNFGSDQRIDYTIIGGQVNLAARLEGICEPDGVMLSHETYALVRDEIEAEALDPIEVKGIREPVTPYAVQGIFEGWDETERYIRRDDVRGLRLWVDLMRQTEEQRLASIRELEEAIEILKNRKQADDAAE